MIRTVSILGCGWLGRALGVALLGEGLEVSGSTTQESKLQEIESLGIKASLINLTTPFAENAASFFNCDVLVICVPPRLKSGGVENYLQQMHFLRDMLQQHTTHRVIFISSTAVYPDVNTLVTEEDADASSPMTQAETVLTTVKKFNVTVLRFGGLVGPGRHPGRFLASKTGITGADNPVNIIHQEDCVGIIRTVIEKQEWNNTFNACADLHPLKKDFYVHASRLLQLDPPQFLNEPAPFKIVSSEKLKQTLSYTFRYPDPLRMFT